MLELLPFIFSREESIIETGRREVENGEQRFLTSAAAQSRLLSLLIGDLILFRRRCTLRTLDSLE